MELAARQVRAEFGMNAMILGTRTIPRKHWLGLRKSEVVEIVAAPPLRKRQQGAAPSAPTAPTLRCGRRH